LTRESASEAQATEESMQRERIYSGRIVELIVDRLQINGREAIREVVRHPEEWLSW